MYTTVIKSITWHAVIEVIEAKYTIIQPTHTIRLNMHLEIVYIFHVNNCVQC